VLVSLLLVVLGAGKRALVALQISATIAFHRTSHRGVLPLSSNAAAFGSSAVQDMIQTRRAAGRLKESMNLPASEVEQVDRRSSSLTPLSPGIIFRLHNPGKSLGIQLLLP
jgi:hypothetical protein